MGSQIDHNKVYFSPMGYPWLPHAMAARPRELGHYGAMGLRCYVLLPMLMGISHDDWLLAIRACVVGKWCTKVFVE
jgi:hypothetical protein